METINQENSCAAIPVPELNLQDPIRDMYRAQIALQTRVCSLPQAGASNLDLIKGVIYWKHCVDDESLELREWFTSPIRLKVESTEFATTLKEMKMEAVDILHFVFNIGIWFGYTEQDLGDMYASRKVQTVCDCELPRYADVDVALSKLQESILRLIRLTPWKTWKTYPMLDSLSVIRGIYYHAYEAVLHATVALAYAVKLSDEGMVNMYFAKNGENHARQDRGY